MSADNLIRSKLSIHLGPDYKRSRGLPHEQISSRGVFKACRRWNHITLKDVYFIEYPHFRSQADRRFALERSMHLNKLENILFLGYIVSYFIYIYPI